MMAGAAAPTTSLATSLSDICASGDLGDCIGIDLRQQHELIDQPTHCRDILF